MNLYSIFVSILCLSFSFVTESVKLKPFSYPRLYKIVDRHVGMAYFAKKLGIDNYLTDYIVLKRTQPYLEWVGEYEAIKETVRNIDACSLKKTDPKLRAEDGVSEEGLKNCLEQCKMENKMYFQFLNSKLQKIIRKGYPEISVKLTHITVTNKPPKKYYRCARKAYKRFKCECTYHKYMIKTNEKFQETFDKIIQDAHGLTAAPDNSKKLEETYKLPMKLISFLITCHLMPTEIFGFLLWWSTTENIVKSTKGITTDNLSISVAKSSSMQETSSEEYYL